MNVCSVRINLFQTMGVDISAYIEIYDGKKWIAAEAPESYIYDSFDPCIDSLGYNFNPPETIYEPEYFQIDRNSAFYNALGGVCSKYEMEELADRRGLPTDIDPITRDYILRFQKNLTHAYGYSWVTLAEIINAEWHKKLTIEKGFVKNEYVHLFSNGKQPFPNELSETDFIYHPLGIYKTLYTEVSWIITYSEAIGEKYLDDILNRLSAFGEPNNVRMIFWYY